MESTNSELEGALRGNYDEIAALQSELGSDMDSMFDDLMASLQPQSSAETKCAELRKRIDVTRVGRVVFKQCCGTQC